MLDDVANGQQALIFAHPVIGLPEQGQAIFGCQAGCFELLERS
jgi:hypothetical protein